MSPNIGSRSPECAQEIDPKNRLTFKKVIKVDSFKLLENFPSTAVEIMWLVDQSAALSHLIGAPSPRLLMPKAAETTRKLE